MNALTQAEEFVKHNNLEAKDFIARLVDLDSAYIESIWSDFHFVVDLRPSMILVLEDQARWRIEHGLIDASEVPNYLDYIYFDALEEVNPEAVTIIH